MRYPARRLLPFLLLALLPLPLEATYKFAFVTHGGPGNPFWNVVIKGMEDAAQRYDVEAQWLSNPTFSIEDMAAFLDDAIAQKVDGIGITCPDPAAIREGIERARDAGIPTIVLNTADPDAGTPNALPTLFYIGASEFMGGQANGRALLAAAAAQGLDLKKALCPIQEVGHSGLEARCAGLRSVLEPAGIKVDGLTISNDIESSAGLLSDYFLGHPQTQAIATLGPLPADAFYLYADEQGLDPGALLHVTHDTSPAIFTHIRNGYTLQAIDQQPYLQGYLTVVFLYLNRQFGLSLATDALTGPFAITAANVDQIEQLVRDGVR
ncbi:MAG: substrate-binding domain-containing protein [Candidatus Latescibacteria bacterium]|nr:substrate-binding domain-containing protein [Candidatus Latescibacterota bacterium]